MKVISGFETLVFAFIFASNVSAIPATPNKDDKELVERGKTPSPDSPITVQRAAMKIYTYYCSKDQKAAVQKAWDEAAVLADAHSKWESPGWFGYGAKYQAAMDTYIGTDSMKDTSCFFGTGPLKSNVLRQRGIHYTDEKWSPKWSYAYFYCNEGDVPKKPEKPKVPQCNKPTQPDKKVGAYTFSDDGTLLWNAKYVVLCPRFFEDEITTLEAKVEQAKNDPDMQKTMSDLWRKIKARVVFHESYHWGKEEVSDPRCNLKPEVYNARKVMELASEENVKVARLNAESWAQAAMATYLQQTFNLSSPPKPASQRPGFLKPGFKRPAPVDATNDNDNSADLEVNDLDAMPDWFAPPVIANALTKGSGQQPEPNPPVPTDDPKQEMLDPSPPPPEVPTGGNTNLSLNLTFFRS
ncbi:hypothetical protein N7G274_008618 [Stereocaulon virgatum]|uniref:Uncharacterized protein n=1 Tax=Stereocaulon virgatum TaxID=373712 RepID=A0ABR3ZY71_9LECA